MNKLENLKLSFTGTIIDLLDKSEALVSSYSIDQFFNYEIKKMYKIKKEEGEEERKRKMKLAATLNYLKRKALLIEKVKDGQKFYILTQKGKQKAVLNRILNYKRERYLKKYNHLVIFDIPEKLRRFRELFCKSLYYLNYERIQKSCFTSDDRRAFELIKKIIEDNKLERFVKTFIIK